MSDLRKAAQQAEPVAWRYALDASVEGLRWIYINQDPHKWLAEPGMAGALIEPLYTAPPQRKPLTVDQISEIDCYDHLKFARRIEKAHGIGGKE